MKHTLRSTLPTELTARAAVASAVLNGFEQAELHQVLVYFRELDDDRPPADRCVTGVEQKCCHRGGPR